MEFELGTAVVAGLAGTAVMTMMLYMGFMLGMRMDMPMSAALSMARDWRTGGTVPGFVEGSA